MLRVRSLEEAEVLINSLDVRIGEVERLMRDHAQRWDTQQTHQWKRLWFWLQGWPMTDLNAPRRNWRPWRRR